MNFPVSAPHAHGKAVVYTELDDATVVLLDTVKGAYYELDAVGSRIWQLLEGGLSAMQLRDALTGEFDVDEPTCLDDLADFLGNLAELGLIVAVETEGAGQ